MGAPALVAAAAAVDALAAPWRTLILHLQWIGVGNGGNAAKNAANDANTADTADTADTANTADNADSVNATPLVSVVLVTYNRPRLVRQALASLMRQDHPRWGGLYKL